MQLKRNKNRNVVTFEKYADRHATKCMKHPADTITYFCIDWEVVAREIGLSLSPPCRSHSKFNRGRPCTACEREELGKLSVDIREKVAPLQSRLERVKHMIAEYREKVMDLNGKVESEVERLAAVMRQRTAASRAEIDEMTDCVDHTLISGITGING